MELIQKPVQTRKEVTCITHQFHLGEDMNVPDAKEDIVEVVQCDGAIRITDVAQMEQYLKVKGEIEYHFLYITDNEDKRMASLNGKIPMEELIYTEGVEDEFQVRCNQLEIEGKAVHSRKVTLEAFVELEVKKTSVETEDMLLDISSDIPAFKKKKKISILQAQGRKKEQYRIKEQMKLSGTKENIGEMLTTQLGCYKLETRMGQDELMFHGEFQFFCMYITDEWKEDWQMQTIPFEGKVSWDGLEEGMYHTVRHSMSDISVDVQMDEDGEMRMLVLEASLHMDIWAYNDQEEEILEDMYALEKNCVIDEKELFLESLVVQKQSRCKIVETLGVPELKDELLQVCNTSGHLQIEKMEVVEEGIMVEGIVHVQFLYVRGNDSLPYASWVGMVPFTHMIECASECASANVCMNQMLYEVEGNLEQVSITMAGNEEIDIRAIVNFQSFIRKPEVIRGISGMEYVPFTKEELEKQAGIIGYIYKEGDDLWTLSKQYHTTPESILKINKISEKEIKTGRKLLIFKENMSIL